MKKLFLLICSVFMLVGLSNAKTVSISGPVNVCPGQGGTYSGVRDFDNDCCGGWDGVEFDIVGGIFQPTNAPNSGVSSDGHTFWIGVDRGNGSLTYGQLYSESCSVTWDNNQHVGTITCRYSWTSFGTHYSAVGSQNVNVGIASAPYQITAPPSICMYSSKQYSLTCPNGLANTGATGYEWAAVNATITGSGANATLTCIGNKGWAVNPITVSVRMTNAGCGVVSPWYTITIPRCTAVTAVPTMTSTGSGTSETVFNFHPAAGGNYTQISTDGVNYYPSSSETVIQGQSMTVWVVSSNDCGNGPAKQFILHAATCPTCTKSMQHAGNGTELNEVRLFPNPANDFLNLEIPETEQQVTVQLINLNGQMVQEHALSGVTKTNLDVQALSPGLYMVHILSADGTTLNTTRKVLIAR
ncbi:MAG: T9SS type A sorting domain-containing protein [Bacteroidia bacterium]